MPLEVQPAGAGLEAVVERTFGALPIEQSPGCASVTKPKVDEKPPSPQVLSGAPASSRASGGEVTLEVRLRRQAGDRGHEGAEARVGVDLDRVAAWLAPPSS